MDTAKSWVSQTSEYVGVFKLGLEFFLKFGRAGIVQVQKETDKGIFLDLKLHDIPNTVAAATSQIADLYPRFLTVHATGGAAMIKAAAQSAPKTAITAVTILTSLDSSDLKDLGFGVNNPDGFNSEALVTTLAKLAVASGATAIVCSPREISAVRGAIPREVSIITPGVRPVSALKNATKDDQKRVLDPKSAIALGADYLVIGRPITQAANPFEAAKEIYFEVR